MWLFVGQLGQMQYVVLLIGSIRTIGERLLPGRPVALAIVAWYQAGQGAGVIGAIVGAIIILVVWGFIAPRFERT